MESEVDSVTGPSSDSLLGDKTTGEDEKPTPIPSSPQSENDPQCESVRKEDKDNAEKPEKTGDVGSSGDSIPKANDEVKMPKLEETQKARDKNERGDGFKLTDEADEDEHQGENMISHEEAEPKPEPSLKEKMTPQTSSPLNLSEFVRKEEKVDKPEKTGESPVNIQRPNEAEQARNINESGEHTDETNEEIEFPVNIQRPNEAEQARNINESGEHTDETDEEIESLQQTAPPGLPQDNQPMINSGWTLFFVVGVLACLVGLYFSDSTPPEPKEFNVVDVFNREMEKLKTSFPNQRPELWKRSLIHIRRHLKTEQPTEPVSLILTSGHRAKRTLDCMARCLAQAFSIAHNSSFVNIDGKSKASQDSDQVKLDIDSELRNAFDGKKLAAVIHRFEELPPGSTLIFYRYCDHENAAYKNVFLAFTVMLDGEEEVPPNINLGRVEEMVQDHVKQKFVSSDKLAKFNQMDVDKLSGLWSRISHLILPVAAEQKIEQQGCGDCDK